MRPEGPPLCLCAQEVSIHAPARGATSKPRGTFSPREFQSTHPRGVRPAEQWTVDVFTGVSIHAPARGATPPSAWFYPRMNCFNPRTREGCGSRTAANNNRNCRFNPRTHMGATSCRTCVAQLGSYFNPRARVGRDLVDQREQRVGHVSIHTPKMGATCT